MSGFFSSWLGENCRVCKWNLDEKQIHLLDNILGSRFWALFSKEVAQIFRNHELVRILLLPPTVFLILFGLALNRTENLKLALLTATAAPRVSSLRFDRPMLCGQPVLRRRAGDGCSWQLVSSLWASLSRQNLRNIARRRTRSSAGTLRRCRCQHSNVLGYISQLVNDYNTSTGRPPRSC